MKMTFRWYGKNDSIPLEYIEQIHGMTGVVTALYSVKVGEVWPLDELIELKELCNKHHLDLEVIESIPVHEDIKLGKPSRDKYIEAYKKNLENCGKIGVKCVCYNFMPVFDWLRTNLNYVQKDNSVSLAFSMKEYEAIDKENLHLPGWDESYTVSELNNLLNEYKDMTHEKLLDNLVYFLEAIMPVCDEYDINMAIHPDDPPFDVFELPRIISKDSDYEKLFNRVPNIHNGITFCTGSLGASKSNNLVYLTKKYCNRIHFAHLRQLKYNNETDFYENGHQTDSGDIDIYNIVKALVENGFDGYVRPDHGRNIFGETGKPGYGLYDRALGAVYLTGLFEAIEKEKLCK